MDIIKRFIEEDDGQGTSEYAVILGIIIVAAIGMLVAFRGKLQEWWDVVMGASI